MSRSRYLAAGVLLIFGLPLQAGDPTDGLDEYVKDAIKEWQVPGVAVAVVKDGEVVLARGYGVAEVHGDQAVTADTIFPIASITKNFTATALAVLVEEGKVQWDDPVIKHLSGLTFSDEYRTQHTTIRDLLCHRTGLERGDLLPRRGDVSIQDIVHRVRYLRPVYGFREKWEYNNLMYYVAGATVAEASKSSWEQFVTQGLLQPLGMDSTACTRDGQHSGRMVVSHRLVGGEVVPDAPEDWKLGVSPAGSMQSTASDMAKWLLANMASEADQPSLLKEVTLREMQSIQMSIPVTWDRTGNRYAARFYGSGLGWTVLDYQGRKVCYHAGSAGTMFAMIPEERLGVVVLTNLDWTNLAGMLMYDVFDAYLLGPDEAWDRGKWEFWKKADPHPDVGRLRDLKQAESKRHKGTKPTLPLTEFSGRYECNLYVDLIVSHEEGKLLFTFGRNRPAPATHWEGNSFYVRRPVADDPSVDWIVSFQLRDGNPHALSILRIGWHESMPTFYRATSVNRESEN